MYKRHWSVTIYVEIYVELYCSNTRGDCNMICWLQFDLYIKSLIVILLNHYTVITALAFMIIVNKKNAVLLCQQVLLIVKVFIECLLHCLVNIPRNIGGAFFYVITCVYTSWKTVVLLFLFHVLDCNAIFANRDLLSTLRPGNFDLHTKMPGFAPAWAVVHKCPVCADLLLVGRRSERLCRRLVMK